MHQIPIDLKKVKKENMDQAILRAAIIAELDAINLYEEMAAMTEDESLKEVLLDVAGEEKTHVGEFQTMLLMRDEEQVREMDAGKEEIEEMLEE